MYVYIYIYMYVYKVEKKIQTDYTFICTSLFRGCPLVRRFKKIYFTIAYIQSNIHNNSSNEAKLNICMSAIARRHEFIALVKRGQIRLEMIRNFSLRHKLNLLLALLYGECGERMRQEIK